MVASLAHKFRLPHAGSKVSPLETEDSVPQCVADVTAVSMISEPLVPHPSPESGAVGTVGATAVDATELTRPYEVTVEEVVGDGEWKETFLFVSHHLLLLAVIVVAYFVSVTWIAEIDIQAVLVYLAQ